MCGGELFVPKIPSMNVMDVAKAIAPDCEIEVTGIRPGEKLHEVMVPKDECHKTLEFDSFYVIQPDFRFWEQRSSWNGGRKVEEGFEYSSGSNPWKLSLHGMREILDKVP